MSVIYSGDFYSSRDACVMFKLLKARASHLIFYIGFAAALKEVKKSAIAKEYCMP